MVIVLESSGDLPTEEEDPSTSFLLQWGPGKWERLIDHVAVQLAELGADLA